MPHHPRIRSLPVELLSLAFDTLPLEDLLIASRVSTFWRDVAFQHRTFWQDIRLAALSETAIDLFLARLYASYHQSIIVQVCLPHMLFPEHIRPAVLSAIACNMHRIAGLYLKVDIDADADVCDVLRLPAPRLTTLDLCFLHGTRTSDALPFDLFAGYAPQLRNVQLINVQLPSHYLPTALFAVRVLRYMSYDSQILPAAVFAHCRAVRELSIWSRHCSLSMDDASFYAFAVENLVFLNMAVVSGSFGLIQRMPCASIQNISAPLADLQSACLLLGNLRGPIEVQLERTAKEALLQYKSLETSMTRIFQSSPAQMVGGKLSRVYVTDDLLSRVESIHAMAESTDMLSAFAYLPPCTRVTMTLSDDGHSLNTPSVPLYVPELLHVDISSATEKVLHVGILHAFLDIAFLAVSHVVQVALEGVKLDGDAAAIPRDRFALCIKQKGLPH